MPPRIFTVSSRLESPCESRELLPGSSIEFLCISEHSVIFWLSRRNCSPNWPMLGLPIRSEEHTSELQSLMRIPYAVFCLQKNNLSRAALNRAPYISTQITNSTANTLAPATERTK